MSAADKIAEAKALIEPLRATVLWQNANPNVMKAADLLAALADLADAQAQRVEEWRQDYRALEGAHRVMREANARLIAERDALAQENARLRDALDPNMTKADYIGEFKQRVCFGTDDDGNEIWEDVTISWTVTKQIMAAIRARAALGDTP